MTRFTTKADLLKEILAARVRLDKVLSGLSPAEKETPGVIADWSVKDILAHLMDWEQRFMGWYQAGVRGETPQTPAPGLTWGQLHELNRQIYERYRAAPLAEIEENFNASSRAIAALVACMTDDDLFRPGVYTWVDKGVMAGWVAANTCNHYEWARTKIRAWMKGKQTQ